MSFSLFLISCTLLFVSVTLFWIMKTVKIKKEKPSLFLLITLGLLLLNWFLFLSSFYTVIPANISERLFLPLWLGIAFIGIIVAFVQARRNITYSIVLGSLSLFSAFIGSLLFGITRM